MLSLGLPKALALLLLGEIPQQNAGSAGGGQAPGANAQMAGNGGDAAPGQPGVAPGSTPNPVPAPPGFIQPQEFYTLNPDNPEERLTGVQVREGLIRANQFDSLQSEYHRQQNQLQQERQAREAAEQELQTLREQERLSTYMQQMGYGQQAQPSPQGQPAVQPQAPLQQQPGQQPGGQGAGSGAEDDWLMNYGFEGTPNAEANLVATDSPSVAPQTPSSQNGLNDPRQLAIMMKAIVKDELSKTITPVQQQLPELVEAAVGQRMNQQARQDGVKQSFQAGRQQLSRDLYQKWGISPERARDILDKASLSQANLEEASRLMGAQYTDPNQQLQAQQVADQKIAQGNMFFSAAIQDAVQAAQEGQAARYQQEAQQQLLTGNYADMGELAEPNTNVWDPTQIQQQNAATLNKAMEIADTQARLQAVAGPNGPPYQPNGFVQPGSVPPFQQTQPVFNPGQAA